MLQEIKKRCEKATPGPWDYTGGTIWYAEGHQAEDGEVEWQQVKISECGEDDAPFIAHAREDIPWLITELSRVTAERDGYKNVLKMAAPAVLAIYEEEKLREIM